MKHEQYFQYTKGWTQINLTGHKRFGGRILDWCNKHGSKYGYHIVRGDQDPYLITAIRFESTMDAMQFAMEWSD